MTEKLKTTRALIEQHAAHLIAWNHAFFEPRGMFGGGKPELVTIPHILAVFEGGGIARFRNEGGAGFRLESTMQFEAGDRIEVNQHQVVMTKTRPETRSHGNTVSTVWHIDRHNEMASGIILMKPDGSMRQLVDWMLRDDVKAANEAVRLRQILGAVEPARVARDQEGFTL